MNSIQVVCGGNFLTKPMYCWGLLDVILLIVLAVSIFFGVCIIIDGVQRFRRRNK